ncbi:MAG TPA: apolipoprotein N-acyltransferase [Microbacteriaceae bacterium]|nr:apolipoprotein N-acyltransferase [Microbacteriaceae bacterium]HQX35814.1 apolipoprotein N-acyltransferase [Microbacteriaceae bacterium]HQZ47859.1 apolipoprotein N-acyltransferase [Microbacteriaceae bacterium]HRA08663.1 apolipoprotein N-acyltransferase [Microbacteriaceae bacterium]
MPMSFALLAAVASGLISDLAFPDIGVWPLIFPGVALMLLALIGRSVWGSVLVGVAGGLSFFLIHLAFVARYLGPVPWVALGVLEALIFAFGAVGIALAYRWMPRPTPAVRLIALPALVAAIWVTRETIAGMFPYGGFPWGRVGLSQSESPLAELASWIGVSGLSFVIVAIIASAIEWARMRAWRSLRVGALSAMPALGALVVALLIPQWATTPAGSFTVATVQGNGPAGYFDQRRPGDVLLAQLAATAPLRETKGIDVLVWPEGSVDIDPLRDASVARALDSLSRQLDAPILLNAITNRGDEYFNTSMLWDDGTTADTVPIYDKRNPVPFGEYVPNRDFFAALAPELIGMIGRDYTPGTNTPVFDINGTLAGLAICFDVIYDDLVWEGAREGAQVFLFQTNNADFRGTDENQQQLAIARMRAIETGRSVVNSSTVGASQVIAPDGSTLDALAADVAGSMVTEVELREGLTPAVVLGGWVPGVLALGALGGLLVGGLRAGVVARRAKRP